LPERALLFFTKGSYQFSFWLIVLGYQFAAYDSLQNSQYFRIALNWLELMAVHRR